MNHELKVTSHSLFWALLTQNKEEEACGPLRAEARNRLRKASGQAQQLWLLDLLAAIYRPLTSPSGQYINTSRLCVGQWLH